MSSSYALCSAPAALLLINASGQEGKNRSMLKNANLYWPGDSHFPRGPDRANIGWGGRKERKEGQQTGVLLLVSRFHPNIHLPACLSITCLDSLITWSSVFAMHSWPTSLEEVAINVMEVEGTRAPSSCYHTGCWIGCNLVDGTGETFSPETMKKA